QSLDQIAQQLYDEGKLNAPAPTPAPAPPGDGSSSQPSGGGASATPPAHSDPRLASILSSDAYKRGEPKAVADAAAIYRELFPEPSEPDPGAIMPGEFTSNLEARRALGVSLQVPTSYEATYDYGAETMFLSWAAREQIPAGVVQSLLDHALDSTIAAGGFE